MKKFYFLLVAMLVSFAAQAWTVQFTNPDNWDAVACYTFSPETNGGWPGKVMTKEGDVWTYTGTGNPGKIIFNNNNKGKQTGDLDFVDGATYDKYGVVGAKLNTYSVYFDNSASNWGDVYVYTFTPEGAGNWPGTKLTANADGLYVWDYLATTEPSFGGIIFNNGGDAQTEDLIFETGKTYSSAPVELDYTTWYVNVVGEFNDWGDNGVQCNEEGVATLNNLAIGASVFKIKIWNGSDVWYSNGETIPLDTPIEITGNEEANMTIEGAEEGDLYNVTFDCKNHTMTIVKAGPIDYTTWYVNVVGTFNNWEGTGVQCDEEGVATVENLEIGTGDFKLKIWNGADDVWYSNGQANALDTPITIVGNNDVNMTIEGAAEGDIYNVTFDCKNNVMTIEKVAVPEPEYPVLTLIGYDFPDLTLADGVYSIELPNLSEDGWSIGNMDDMNVIAIKDGTEVNAGVPFEVYYLSYDVVMGGNEWVASTDFVTDNKVKITLTGDVDAFVADSMKPITMLIQVNTGVAELEAAEADAVYFNLQGVRVANPENGMFIKVQGEKAVKVAL